ncbi:MAG: AMP-binding protein [Bacteroidales bacterium]|jgi:long-chain acyl-CoA synthetase|nr:AMP-binding protein [Bacteroidales bacterium]MDD4213722.1 AMP-binding protein [Bacteroidales bacterium]
MANFKIPLTFPALFSNSVQKFPDNNALSFVDKSPITYKQMNQRIYALIAYLEDLNVKQGDKIAILSTNMPNWGIAYFAITFMGAVAVPLLPDFNTDEIEKFISHSETRMLFVSENLRYKLKGIEDELPKDIIIIDDFSYADSGNQNVRFDIESKPEKNYTVEESTLAAIIYTSGTTGNPKGVMLTHKNICFDAIKSRIIQPVNENDRFLSVLPLSHTYENTLGLILSMISGACTYYLSKPPTPAILLPALQMVRPTIMLTVPLIIEKIFRNSILPKFTKGKLISYLYSLPFFRKILHLLAGKKLMKTFGGEIKFFGIGGAKLDKTIERFLIEARFPYAIGYGLTETSPLLAGANPKFTRLQSTGPAMEGVELKIANPDKITGEGEIWARGANIMMGYYKDMEQTRKVLDESGWFKTGDLGMFDKNNFLYIKGRLKNMIVMNNGENVYPEEIETVINNFNYVSDSLVVEEKGKLVALVYFNKEEIEKKYQHIKTEVSAYVEHKIEELKIELKEYINKRVNKFSRIHLVIARPDPFKKTATQKIKRFLYSKNK